MPVTEPHLRHRTHPHNSEGQCRFVVRDSHAAQHAGLPREGIVALITHQSSETA